MCSLACINEYSSEGVCPALAYGDLDEECEFGEIADCEVILEKGADTAKRVVLNKEAYGIKTGA